MGLIYAVVMVRSAHAQVSSLLRTSMFAGLGPTQLEAVAARMRPRVFAPGEPLCRIGEVSDRLWIITGGLVYVLVPDPSAGSDQVVARQRTGDTVGEVGSLLGEDRRATVIARTRTTTLELDAAAFVDLVQVCPQIMVNVIRTLRVRLARARARSVQSRGGERVVLAAGQSLEAALPAIIAAVRRASPRPVTYLQRDYSLAGAVIAADALVADYGLVLLATELDPVSLAAILGEVDRVIVLAGTYDEARQIASLDHLQSGRWEAVLVGHDAGQAAVGWPGESHRRVVRRCERRDGFPISPVDVAWLARHITRTKLGLALGAGGAKGYAHVGVIQALEDAGYVIDYVSGSSIGGIVATYLALGMDAQSIDAVLRRSFDATTVEKIFGRPTLAGNVDGVEIMASILRQTTRDRTFADTAIPLVLMAADLTDRSPAPLRQGPLWEALLATTALAGVFPPRERDGHRLVDGLALVPVPTGCLLDCGADITVAVNLIARETLPRWPRADVPAPPPGRQRRPGMLDTLLEVMDLSQLDTSVGHAGLADVVITPRFGPCHWRDFHLADHFLAAGRAAAKEQLAILRSLAPPNVAFPSNHQRSKQ